ncbi:MAG: hypothetical protein WCG23_10395 [bacterium]
MNIENRPFTLPANHIGQQVIDATNSGKVEYYKFLGKPDKAFEAIEVFANKHSSIFGDKYNDMQEDIRKDAIIREFGLGSLKDVLPKIPEADRATFLKLREDQDQNDKKQAEDIKSNPIIKTANLFLNSVKNQYAQFLDNNRPDPSKVSDPHPNNIRVLAAVSQNEAATGTLPGEKADWVTRKFSDALGTEASIDKAMDKTSKDAAVMGYSNAEAPTMQKPVTTRRENNTAWQKADNNNPDIKRVVIFNVTEDGSGNFKKGADELRKNFYTPDEKNESNPFETRFRADKIITVTPPTKEEEKQGITQADKIRQAFEQSKQFMEDQKDLARKNAIAEGKDPEAAVKALKFEGMANWFGHGTTVKEKSPEKDDPRRYQEGSAEFKFWTNSQKNEGIEESDIKKMEQNVKDFSYFTEYFNSCHSGAMTN